MWEVVKQRFYPCFTQEEAKAKGTQTWVLSLLVPCSVLCSVQLRDSLLDCRQRLLWSPREQRRRK